MDFPARKYGTELRLSPEMARLKEAYIQKLREDEPVIISIKRLSRNKTWQQVKCHWGLVVTTIRREFADRGMDLATFLNSPTIPNGLEVPADVIQAVLYATCNDVGENGERKTLSKMSTVEASRFFSKCQNYAASAWAIQIPDPDPLWATTRSMDAGCDMSST
jgi:hypothetical protein